MTDLYDLVQIPPDIKSFLNDDYLVVDGYHESDARNQQSWKNVERFSPELEFNVDDFEHGTDEDDEDSGRGYCPTGGVFNSLLRHYSGYELVAETDATCDIEFKPQRAIPHSDAKSFFTSIERAMDMTNLFYGKIEVGDNCGTHIHYSYDETPKSTLSNAKAIRYYLMAITDWMNCYDNRVVKVFGRFFGNYRTSFHLPLFNDELYTGDLGHGNWINLSPVNKFGTIEIRLPKFVSAEQYWHAYKIGRNMVRTIHEFDSGSQANPIHEVDKTIDMINNSFEKIGDGSWSSDTLFDEE